MRIISTGKGIHSPEFYKKKLKRRRFKRILLSIALFSFFFSIIFLLRQEKLLIQEVSVPGEEVVGKDKVIESVESLLAGSYMWLFPRANALIYPESEIESALSEKFPRYKSVELDLEGFSKLNVLVEEREPFALYCKYPSECYFLDEGGFIFALAPSFSDGVYFVYQTIPAREEAVGYILETSGEFELMSDFIQSVKEFGVHARELEIGNEDYALVLSNGAEIIWAKDADLSIIYSNLKAFLSDDAIRSQGNFLDKITILDLRTENKIFYRFRAE